MSGCKSRETHFVFDSWSIRQRRVASLSWFFDLIAEFLLVRISDFIEKGLAGDLKLFVCVFIYSVPDVILINFFIDLMSQRLQIVAFDSRLFGFGLEQLYLQLYLPDQLSLTPTIVLLLSLYIFIFILSTVRSFILLFLYFGINTYSFTQLSFGFLHLVPLDWLIVTCRASTDVCIWFLLLAMRLVYSIADTNTVNFPFRLFYFSWSTPG